MRITVAAVYEGGGVLKLERPVDLKEKAKEGRPSSVQRFALGSARSDSLQAQMIFVDTSFFIALLDPQDTNHQRAVEAFHAFQRQAAASYAHDSNGDLSSKTVRIRRLGP